jgi:hypothetical protein
LWANASNAEQTGINFAPESTGFNINFTGPANWIYIAIRRGPMKVPTTGTSVFSPVVSAASQGTKVTTNFPIDSQWLSWRAGLTGNAYISDRLRGNSTTSTSSGLVLNTSNTGAENSVDSTQNWDNTGFQIASYWSGGNVIYWNFQRAPGFFDEVCYTGTAATSMPVTHNLGVVPELMIVKWRNGGGAWIVYSAATGATNYLMLQDTAASASLSTAWNNTAPTTTAFTVGQTLSGAGANFVAYLFATCPGVSKVGSYTGTGATQLVACGFAAGARFVLIKATSTTGSWYVWDSARGIVAGNDPYLQLNSTAAEVTNTDWVDTATTGFELSNAGGNLVNSNGVSYIFLAIA